MTTDHAQVDQTLSILLTPDKGLIAPDEHPDLLARAVGVDIADPLTRSRHRSMVLSTPDLPHWIVAAVVDVEAFGSGEPVEVPPGIVVGVRLGSDTDHYRYGDTLARRTEQLRAELSRFRAAGVRFVKWRADLDPLTGPASAYLDASHLAACAAASLECELAPVLDVAMPNQRTHSLSVATAVTANALTSVHRALLERGCDPGRVLVRMNMVRAGTWHEDQTTALQVGRATLRVLSTHLPEQAPGVMFMSTGMSGPEACADLAAITAEAGRTGWDRPCTFGFGRALLSRGTHAWGRDGTHAAHDHIAQDCAAAAAATRRLPVTA